MRPHDRITVNILSSDPVRSGKEAQARLRKHSWPVKKALTSASYISIFDAASVERVDLFYGNIHDRPRRPRQINPGWFDLYCAMDGTAVLEQTQPAQDYVVLRVAQTMLSQIPALKTAVWPAVDVPPDADRDRLDAIVADAVRPRPPLPKAVHPEFKKSFSGSIYNPQSLQSVFSGDEGADVWDTWRKKPLDSNTTVRQMIDQDSSDTDTFVAELQASRDSRLHHILIATCFTLLRRTNHIDPEGRHWLVASLQDNAGRGSQIARTALTDLRQAGLLPTAA